MHHSAPSWRSRAGGFVLLGGMFLLAGCGGSQGTVSGKVTYKNVPLRGGTVSFISEGGGVATADIKEDGSYTATKVPLGPSKVTVETLSLRPAAKGGFQPPTLPKDAIPPGVDPSQMGGLPNAGDASRYVPIPDQYGDIQRSGLSYIVKSGKQSHDIDLK